MQRMIISVALVVFVVTGLFAQSDQPNRAQAVYDSVLANYKADIYKYIDTLCDSTHPKVSGPKALKLEKMIKSFLKQKEKFDKYLKVSNEPQTTVDLDPVLVKAVHDYSTRQVDRSFFQYWDRGTLSVYLSSRFGYYVEVKPVFHQFGRWVLGGILALIALGVCYQITHDPKISSVVATLIYIACFITFFFVVF